MSDYLDLDELNRIASERKIEPVTIEGYSNYQIHPDGMVWDLSRKAWVHMNRHMNFCMFPDKPNLDGKQKPIPDLFNIRSLIKQIVDSGQAPGFDKYLPEYKPPTTYSYLKKGDEETDGTPQKRRELHLLRKELEKASNKLLEKVSAGAYHEDEKVRYNEVQTALEFFKQSNPGYYKWLPFIQSEEEETDDERKLREEEIDINADLEYLKGKREELTIRLNQLLGYNNGLMGASNYGKTLFD